MTGIELIAQERQEQLTKHKRTVEQDKEFNNEHQLVDAAGALVIDYPEGVDPISIHGNFPPIGWDKEIWKNMLRKDYKSRLIIAGALIAAEYDRVS